jgi:hypothetical protein
MPSAAESSRFRFTYLILGLSIVVVIGSYLFSLWTASQEEKALFPLPAVDQLVKALRSYHHQVGKFPENLIELETRVWRHRVTLNVGEDGRSLSMANYYYIYYPVDPSNCTLWAIPINKRRQEASTFFLALSPETVRRWKGAPLAFEEIKRLPALPEPAQLALLGLTEQQPIQIKATGNARKSVN